MKIIILTLAALLFATSATGSDWDYQALLDAQREANHIARQQLQAEKRAQAEARQRRQAERFQREADERRRRQRQQLQLLGEQAQREFGAPPPTLPWLYGGYE